MDEMAMKKYLLGAVALTVAHSAFAVVCVPYLSAGASRDAGSWDFNNGRSGSAAFKSMDDRASGWTGQLYAGCDFVFNKFALGAEFGGGLSNDEFRYRLDPTPTYRSFKNKGFFAFGVVPSYSLNGQLLYTRILATWGKLQYNTNNSSEINYQFNEYDSGGIFGFGVLAPISSRLAIKTEYDYSRYSRVSKDSAGQRLSWKPSQDSYLMGLNFYFMPRFNENNLRSLMPGFYVGVGGGRDLVTINKRMLAGGVYDYLSEGLTGWMGQLLTGYDFKLFRRMRLGAEARFSYSSAVYEYVEPNSSSSWSWKYRLREGYSILGKMGVDTSVSNDIYVLGGASWSKLIKSGGEAYGNNFNKLDPGWLVGIGDQFSMTNHLSASIEGSYARYRKINIGGSSATDLRWTPSDERASVNLIYTF